MADKVTWFELPADDTNRASNFYKDVFDWTMSDMGGGSMAAQAGPADDDMMPLEKGSINGDISPRSKNFDKTTLVVSVDDIHAKIDMVVKAGGKLMQAPEEMEGMGMLWAIVHDTEGNSIGLTQDI